MNGLKIRHDIKGLMNRAFITIRKDGKIMATAVILGLIIVIMHTKAYSDNIQGDIADRILRLHILAESDRECDQQLKLKVRDRILEKLKDELKKSESKSEAVEVIRNNKENIKKWGKEVIKEEGFDYDIDAEICTDYFPTKKYGNVSLPRGEYETLRVTIGKGKGHNWWCVMYPPLCFVDMAEEETVSEEETEKLKESLTEEEYRLVTGKSDGIKFKFKIVELFEGF